MPTMPSRLQAHSNSPQTLATATRLATSPLFEGLDSKSLQRVAALTRREEVGRGEVLVKQGEYGDIIYVLEEGSVEIRATNGAGKERTLSLLRTRKPNEQLREDVFGEMCLLDLEPRSATVITTEPSVLLLIHRDDLYWLFGEDRGLQLHVTVAIARLLSQRLRRGIASVRRITDWTQSGGELT